MISYAASIFVAATGMQSLFDISNPYRDLSDTEIAEIFENVDSRVIGGTVSKILGRAFISPTHLEGEDPLESSLILSVTALLNCERTSTTCIYNAFQFYGPCPSNQSIGLCARDLSEKGWQTRRANRSFDSNDCLVESLDDLIEVGKSDNDNFDWAIGVIAATLREANARNITSKWAFISLEDTSHPLQRLQSLYVEGEPGDREFSATFASNHKAGFSLVVTENSENYSYDFFQVAE